MTAEAMRKGVRSQDLPAAEPVGEQEAVAQLC